MDATASPTFRRLAHLLFLFLFRLGAQVFDQIDEYAPGFRDLIVGYEVLTPPDLERVFGLTGGVSPRSKPSKNSVKTHIL